MFGKPMSTHCAEIGCNIILMILIQYKLLYYIRFVFVYFSVNQDCLRQKNCSQLCQQTKSGALCFCKPGFVLDSDGISCKGKCKLVFFC